jgi:hypothetical protein
MNDKIVVVGADSGVLRIFERNTGQRIKVTSVNDSEWSRNSVDKVAMHGDNLVVMVTKLEGGARSDRARSVFLLPTANRIQGGDWNLIDSWSWWSTEMRIPPVDTYDMALLIGKKRVVASMEIIRVWPLEDWYGRGSLKKFGRQIKLSSKILEENQKLDEAELPPEPMREEADSFALPVIIMDSKNEERKKEKRERERKEKLKWSAHAMGALYMDEDKIISGDRAGILRVWSFL